ncbi:MAG: carbon storage regulator [Pirellulales bacterium]
MLVLTRKYQEKVHIGDGITITVLRTKGKAVRLGIEAPPEVPVIRGELTFEESPAESVEGSAAWHSESLASKATPKVTLKRVPRHKADQILPQLLSGDAPLREMLEQRSRAV